MVLQYKNCTFRSLRFNRWTNTSYAIFNSIGRVVHIGFLSKIIHGLSTVKSISIYRFNELAGQVGFILEGEEGFNLADKIEDLVDTKRLVLAKSLFQLRPVSERSDINYIVYNLNERPVYGPFFICRFFQAFAKSTFLYSGKTKRILT